MCTNLSVNNCCVKTVIKKHSDQSLNHDFLHISPHYTLGKSNYEYKYQFNLNMQSDNDVQRAKFKK